METRTQWGMVAVAGVFVLLIIAGAVSTVYFKTDIGTIAPVAFENSQTSTASGDWMSILSEIATTTLDAEGNYIAPQELPPTERVSREVLAAYLSLKADGTLSEAEKNEAISEIIARNITPINIRSPYLASSLKISDTADIGVYAGALTRSLSRSAMVKEYELTTFSKTIGQKNYAGTPALASAAEIYKGIEKDLQAMTVPRVVSQEHLALLNAVASLSNATKLLSTWSGDPLMGLSYADAFVQADNETASALTALYDKLGEIGETQS